MQTSKMMIKDVLGNQDATKRMVHECLERIGQRESVVKAWAWIDKQQVLDQLGQQLKNSPSAPLAGIPVGIKDIIDTAEMHTQYGSAAYKGYQPIKNAVIIDWLRQCGAVIMGKTVTTEFAYTHAGPTTNPIRATHSPGGSSSGSAAAVADNMVPVAIGTQTGGSVLRPSSYCGIYALKPTFGLLQMDGVMPFAHSLDTFGIHARHIEDIETVLQALVAAAGKKLNPDQTSENGKSKVKLAWFPGYEASLASDDAHSVLKQARDAWSARPDVTIDDIDLSENLFGKIGHANHVIMMYEGSKVHQMEYHAQRDVLGRASIDMVEQGMAITEHEYQQALKLAQACRDEFRQKMQGFDALLTFSAPGEAPLIEEGTGSSIFNRPWTTIGSPAITIPFGKGRSGMPIGVQLVGHHDQDLALLRLAKRLDQVV